MDPLDYLPVRFHYNGEFLNIGLDVDYIGGVEAMSYIERDKLSLPELRGHFKDHCSEVEDKRFFWCFPGGELRDGLKLLWDDSSCQLMSTRIDECGVAEIYVETISRVQAPGIDDSDFEDELEELCAEASDEDEMLGSRRIKPLVVLSPTKESREKEIANAIALKEFYSSPKSNKKSKEAVMEPDIEVHESTDEDYNECTSEEDDEAAEIIAKYREFKKQMRAGRIEHLDDVLCDVVHQVGTDSFVGEDNGADGTSYEDSDFEASFDELGSDGELVLKKSKYPRFKDNSDVPQFTVGMKFDSKRDFKQAIIRYGIGQKKMIRFVKDEGKRVRVKCDWPSCPWVCLLALTTRSTSWQITTLNDVHVCPPRKDNRLVTSSRIAAKYENLIRANPTWKLDSMKAHIQEEMFADVSIHQVKRAKKLVMQKWMDANRGQYSRIFDYQAELLRSNPGSTVVVKLDPDSADPMFQRIYICLAALKKGLMAGCRKVIGLDGCFFKGSTNGELLCAIGRDGNNQMYPIAWAVVEKETNDSWDWFCQLLFNDVKVYDGDGWVFISDQQKGIINAVRHWAPLAEHRNCARHIYANWRKTYKKKEWQKKFWRCAKASSVSLFNLARAKLAQETVEGARAVMNTDPHQWSRAWFKLGSNCDSVDNNMCESFNKWIVEARFLPILTMLEALRRKVMVRVQENRTKSDKWNTRICPNINKKLIAYITESGACHAISNGDDHFEVKHLENRYTVDLNKRTCSCRYWQLSGLPCSHAIACIHFKTNTLDAYVAKCYTVAEFKKVYAHCLQPCEGMSAWPTSERPKPVAPKYVKMPGRPRKERKREPEEKPKGIKVSKVGTIVRCRLCKSTGHNRTTCSENPRNTQSGTAASQSSAQAPKTQDNNMQLVQASQQSVASTSKRKSSRLESQEGSKRQHCGTSSANSGRSIKKKAGKAFAKVTVKTSKGGTASMNLQASVPGSANVSLNMTSGSAVAHVHAQEEPTKQKKLPALCMED